MASFPTLSRRHFLLLPALFHPVTVIGAQPLPNVDGSTSMMVAAILPSLPSVTSNVRLTQYVIGPGASVAPFAWSSSALMMVQSGGMTLTSDLPVIHRLAGEIGPARWTDVPPEGLALESGDGVLITHGSTVSFSNPTPDPSHVLMLIVSPRSEDDPSTALAEEEVEWEDIGAGLVTFHRGAAILILEHITLESRHPAISSTFKGTEIGIVVEGHARLLCDRGRTWVTPQAVDQGGAGIPGSVPVPSHASIELHQGDAYATYDGTMFWRSQAEQPLILLRAQVIPVPQPA